jgi:hypothetical protein
MAVAGSCGSEKREEKEGRARFGSLVCKISLKEGLSNTSDHDLCTYGTVYIYRDMMTAQQRGQPCTAKEGRRR